MNMTISPEEFMQYHSYNTIPNLIALFLVSSLIFLGIGLLVVKKTKEARMKIFMIWFYSVLLSGLFLLFLVFMPNVTQGIINSLVNLQ